MGAPDFFVTFTCNPRWPEISRELQKLPGQRAEDRPDLLARVFRMKNKKLMQRLKENKIFGEVVADISVTEFQKRGLPHSHIYLTLAEQDKPITPDQIDQFICAEIPDKVADPLAYETVVRCMIHGPCGPHNQNAPCIVDGKCSKHYPHKFSDQTTVDDNGFYQYRRRCDPNNTVFINGVEIDNRWVVPYNRDLLVEFDAHINVEKCASSELMKYLYKYIYKGEYRATIIIENNVQNPQNNGQTIYRNVDEVKQYLDCRYVSAVEAFWRIYDFELQKQSPHVERLRFHLPIQQYVVFNDNDHLHDVLNREGVRDTMLTKWFEANITHTSARNYTYVEFPKTWVWRKDRKEWTVRKQGKCVGRLPYAHPNSGELYYLRMLLYKVCGTQSYEDIRTFNGNVYPTFKHTCAARGLLDDDNEWHEAISEASTWASPINLRNMFCTMLMFSELTDPVRLWEQNWKAMVDDFRYRVRREFRDNIHLDDDELKEWGLQEIECILNRNGKKLADFPPMPQLSSTSFGHLTNKLIREELDYYYTEEANLFRSYFQGLNSDQLRVFNSVIEAHERKCGGLFFVNGSGGTGKTYLWRTLIAKFRSEKKIVLSVASSGIATLLLPGGRTAHSRFKIPIDLHDKSTCSINTNSDLAELIREASLIIWDEAPMLHQHGFKAVSKTIEDVVKETDSFLPNKPFGGKLCILGGDFKQILPVVTKGRREAIVAATLHKSELWRHCRIMHLKINMRLCAENGSSHSLQELHTFAEWITKIGEGKIERLRFHEGGESDWIEVPQKFLIKNEGNSLQQLISSIYPHIESNFKNPAYLKERTILAPKNKDVDEINSIMLAMLPGESKQFCSADKLCPSESTDYEQTMHPTELLHSIKISGVPNHCIELKVGAPIMLLKNINQALGLCNGTRLTVLRMGEKVIEARVITGSHFGKDVLIPRITLSISGSQTFIPMKRRQFPIKLAFAMTINKSQGQTLERVGLYLQDPVFTHGQLYLALSRVTHPSGLKILICNREGMPENCTKNIVYPEVLAAVRD